MVSNMRRVLVMNYKQHIYHKQWTAKHLCYCQVLSNNDDCVTLKLGTCVNHYPLAALQGKMAQWLAQGSEGFEFESLPGPNSVVSLISQNIEISLCIGHFESLCDRDYPPHPLDQMLW